MSRHIKIGEAAKLLGVTPQAVRRWEREGEFSGEEDGFNAKRSSIKVWSGTCFCVVRGTECAQEAYFRQACGVSRFTWNWALEEWKRQSERGDKPNGLELKKVDL